MRISMVTVRRDAGFTLVELSIVLVILGLLVGGVLSGQALIRSAELRKVLTQYSGFQTAVNAFKDKYFSMPGDMANAGSYWGLQSTNTTTCLQTGSMTATCNGNGDGKIDYDNGSTYSYEGWRAWQHLALGGLIEGSYSGAATNVPTGWMGYVPGTNTPRGPLGSSVWGLFLIGSNYAWTTSANQEYHVLVMGSITPSSAGWDGRWHNGVMKPEDLYTLDKKIDDGKPYRGTVKSLSGAGYNKGCANSDTDAATDYNLSSTAISCIFMGAVGL